MSQAAGLVVSPFLHIYPDRIESPLTAAVLTAADPLFALLYSAPTGQSVVDLCRLSSLDLDRLKAGGFLVLDEMDTSRSYRLQVANIETCSTCNHRCAFCPVSESPRAYVVMPQMLFERVVDQVVSVGAPGVGVFLNNYNEPTIDPLFLERLRCLFARGVPAALLTNASRLTPDTSDAIRSLGQLRYLGVNLPTIEPERYRELHGTSDLPRILRNIDYILQHPISGENAFVVLGYGDERHQRDLEEIRERYRESGWAVREFAVQGRSGLVKTSHGPIAKSRLAGCELVGSRPLNHVHVTASGKVILCCQDYYEHYAVGDLSTQSLHEVLSSDSLALLRRFAYGAEEAPEDFICRRCEFALERP